MADFQGTLLFDSTVNLEGLTRGAQRAKALLDSIGKDATKTFQNDIGRALGNAVRPENIAADVAKSKALLKSIGIETSKTFEATLGRRQAKALLQPFVDETTTFGGIIKKNLASAFNIKNLALGVGGGLGLAFAGKELIQLGKDAVVFAAQFESALAKVQTIADKGINMQNVRKEIEELSRRVPQDLIGLTEGLFDIIGSGVRKTSDALNVLEVSAKAATAGAAQTSDASKAIVFLLNAFQKEATEAEHVADILFKTVDEGVVSFAELASQIGDVAAPAALAGVSIEELGALFAVLTKNGINAAESATAIRGAITSIIAPSESARKAAQAFGLDFSKAGITAANGIAKFIDQIRLATGADLKAINQLFPDARAAKAISVAAGTGAAELQRLADAFLNSSETANSMNTAFELVNKTAEQQYKIFKNNLAVSVVEAGDSILNFFKPALEAINKEFDNTDPIDALIKRFETLGTESAKAAIEVLKASRSLELAKQAEEELADLQLKTAQTAANLEAITDRRFKQIKAAREEEAEFLLKLAKTEDGRAEIQRRIERSLARETEVLTNLAESKRQGLTFSKNELAALNTRVDKERELQQALKQILILQRQAAKPVSGGVQTLGIAADVPFSQKSKEELERLVALGGEQAENAKKELKIREEIQRVVEQTSKELEILRTRSAVEAELVKIQQRFDEIRKNAHGSLTALRQIAILEQDAIDKVIASRGKGTGILRGNDLSKAITAKLPANFLIEIKAIDIKRSAIAKFSDQIRDELSNIAFPIQAFLNDLDRLGIATQSELVGLADLFDRGIGDILDSFFKFKDQLSGGTLLGSFLGGAGFAGAVAPFVSKLLDGFLGRSEEMRRIDAIQRASAEQAAQAALQLKESMEQLRQVFLTLPVIELENELRKIGDEIEKIVGVRNITAESLEKVFGLELQAQDLRRQIEDAESRGLFDLAELLRKDLDKVEAELSKFGFSVINLTAAQIERLRELTKGSDEFIKSLERFGQFANNFSGLVEQLNFKFDVLNIDDPLKKLDLLAKGIRDKFKAIIPTTDAGIRDLIAKGLEALEAGGQTLVDFLKGLDLEELTADQFRDFLQLLNQLANEAKSKVDDIVKTTDEDILVSAVRQITFTQGNKLIDELTTMRIIQTQMLDIMRGASLRAPDFKNFGIPGNRIIVVNNTGVTEGSEVDLRGLNRRQLELAIAASRAQGIN